MSDHVSLGPADPALGTQVLSRVLQISPRTVANLIDSGQLPGHKIPGSRARRVLRSSLVAFCHTAQMPPAIIAAAERAERNYTRGPRKEAPCPASTI
jgi:hypothetical protein